MFGRYISTPFHRSGSAEMIVFTTISWIFLNKISTSRAMISFGLMECLRFFKYSLKARKVHLDFVVFVLLSYSERESSWLPGRTNGFEGPLSFLAKPPLLLDLEEISVLL